MALRTAFHMVSSHQTKDLEVSQIAMTFHRIRTPFFIQTWLQQYCRCPFLAVSAIPFVSYRGGVDVQWFQDKSSHDLPNSKDLSVQVTLGFVGRSKNFCKLFCVSWEVFVLHGYDCIHCGAKSCTTTACRWLFRDSHPPLWTLWSAIIKSPKLSALGTTVPVRLLRQAHVYLVLQQMLQFRYIGKWVKKKLCLPSLLLAALKVIHEKNWKLLDVLEHFHAPVHAWTPVANLAHLATGHCVVLRRRHFYFGFSISAGFSVLTHSYSHFFLLLDIPWWSQYPEMKM